jgi:radical SAM-linked protein
LFLEARGEGYINKMQQIEVKYTKGEAVRFLSHRDLMRAFQRAVRRADLPMAYSQGFNPHMKISWGQALKVGATSAGETAKLHIDGWIKPRELQERLNRELPPGIEIIEAFVI